MNERGFINTVLSPSQMTSKHPLLMPIVAVSLSAILVSCEKKDPIEAMLSAYDNPDDASNGDLYRAGFYYERAKGHDIEKAAVCYRRLAERGAVSGQFEIARLCESGLGVPQDYKAALDWYLKAAEQGDVRAQNKVAAFYLIGVAGISPDASKGVVWCQKAAEQKNPEAQLTLGLCYAEGRGVTKDEKQAVVWYQKAAEQGYANAQCHLGMCYADGKGVPQDFNAAVLWLTKAAAQGQIVAPVNLGDCYARKSHDPQDQMLAACFYLIAAQKEPPYDYFPGRARYKKISQLLTNEQLALVQEMASRWIQEHPIKK